MGGERRNESPNREDHFFVTEEDLGQFIEAYIVSGSFQVMRVREPGM